MEQKANKYQTVTLQLDSFEHSKYVNMVKTEKKKKSFTSAAGSFTLWIQLRMYI